MKLRSLLLTAAASALSGGAALAAAEAPPESVFLLAIRQVETGDRYDAPVGRNGEVGPYQFKRQLWRRYTQAPLADARTHVSDLVASRHFAWIKRSLEHGGKAATPWNIAAAWNGGVQAVCSNRVPRAARDYAGRVCNLVRDAIAQDEMMDTPARAPRAIPRYAISESPETLYRIAAPAMLLAQGDN